MAHRAVLHALPARHAPLLINVDCHRNPSIQTFSRKSQQRGKIGSCKYLVEIPTAGPSADTLISRNHTKMRHCSLLRQSAKRKVDIICAMEDRLLYRDEVYAIQGALFEVYKTMGNMWGEDVYQQCLFEGARPAEDSVSVPILV